MKIKKEAIVNALRQHRQEPMAFRDLMQLFGVDKRGRAGFKTLIDDMVAADDVVRLKGNRFALASDSDVISGVLSTHRAGYGFVAPEDGGADIFIPARHLRDNLHGDRVEVRVTAVKEGGRREGRIVGTVTRAVQKVVGRYEAANGTGRVTANDRRITSDIVIPRGGGLAATSGQVVVAEVTSYPVSGRPAMGRITEILGWPEETEVEVLTIIRSHDLPYEFSAAVLAAARAVPETVTADDRRGRIDLRNVQTVTIDGETARDFDDAVAVRREDGGRIRLWVSIADVSHYVREDSLLDVEAYSRGTSVYFPDRCIPMLPERLSNGICSLNPEVERLTLTAEIVFDTTGGVETSSFYPSVIRSAARLTYTEVRQILVDRDPVVLALRKDLVADLTIMEELALRLTARRRQRGSIDFDLPEPQIILDLTGQMVNIVRAERNLAHRIIEEFMLAANEAVATFLEKRQIPSLYRVHEQPDSVKLQDFQEFVKSFGHEFRMEEDRVEPREFQRLLDAVEGKPEERLVNEVLLRCMKQARYAAENMGHFGLAAPSYTHFTSPIRRYPDLVVHRILKAVLAEALSPPARELLAENLPETAAHTSRRERIAMEAEREIVELKKVQFMLDKVGEEFDGFITGVTTSGFFVELIDLFIEGMVRLASLPADFYSYREKQHLLLAEGSRTTYRLGDRIRVRVGAVSLERKEIDFVLTGHVQTGHPVFLPEEYPRLPVRGKQPKGRKPAGKKGERHGGSAPSGARGSTGGGGRHTGRGGKKGGSRRGR